jgi:hypothetical protein
MWSPDWHFAVPFPSNAPLDRLIDDALTNQGADKTEDELQGVEI